MMKPNDKTNVFIDFYLGRIIYHFVTSNLESTSNFTPIRDLQAFGIEDLVDTMNISMCLCYSEHSGL